MKTGSFLIYIFVILLLQLGVLAALGIQGYAPNVVLLALIWLVFNVSLWDALLAACAWGFFLDIYSAAPFGLNTIALLFTVITLFWIVNYWLPKEEHLYVIAGALIFGTLFHQIISFGIFTGLSAVATQINLDLSRFFNWPFVMQFFLNIILYYPFRLIARRYINISYEQKPFRT